MFSIGVANGVLSGTATGEAEDGATAASEAQAVPTGSHGSSRCGGTGLTLHPIGV